MTLTKSLIDALADCDDYTADGSLYWWTPAAMKKLKALGLVERYRHPSLADSQTFLPWRLTEAGRAALAKATGKEG